MYANVMPSAQFWEGVRTGAPPLAKPGWGMVRAADRPVCRWLKLNLVIPLQESSQGQKSNHRKRFCAEMLISIIQWKAGNTWKYECLTVGRGGARLLGTWVVAPLWGLGWISTPFAHHTEHIFQGQSMDEAPYIQCRPVEETQAGTLNLTSKQQGGAGLQHTEGSSPFLL